MNLLICIDQNPDKPYKKMTGHNVIHFWNNKDCRLQAFVKKVRAV